MSAGTERARMRAVRDRARGGGRQRSRGEPVGSVPAFSHDRLPEGMIVAAETRRHGEKSEGGRTRAGTHEGGAPPGGDSVREASQ
jgi:hypothetical protein